MNKRTINIVLLGLGVLAFVGASFMGINSEEAGTFEKRPQASELPTDKSGVFHCRIDFNNGAALTYVEIAKTKKEMEQGYQNRTSADDGMLFVWPDSDYRVFYSRNIIIPIDLVYINETGAVVDIKQMAIKSDEHIKSTHKAKYVLELARSRVSLLKIQLGSAVAINDCK